ncbi:MAG: hypothetical protein WEF53_01615 [Bacteroidota bacterium]
MHRFEPEVEINELEKRRNELLETTRHLNGDGSARLDETTYSSILDFTYPFAAESIDAEERADFLDGIRMQILHINDLIAELTTIVNRIESGEATVRDEQVKEVVLDRAFCNPFIPEKDEVVVFLSDKPSLNGSGGDNVEHSTWTGTKKEFAVMICEEYDLKKSQYPSLVDATRKLFSKHVFADRNWTVEKCYDLVRQVCPQESEKK